MKTFKLVEVESGEQFEIANLDIEQGHKYVVKFIHSGNDVEYITHVKEAFETLVGKENIGKFLFAPMKNNDDFAIYEIK